MDNQIYAIREFYDVIFTAGYDLKMGDTIIPEGDIILSFSEIPSISMQEIRDRADAVGGYGNRSRVSWDETRGLAIDFRQGNLSMRHLAFLSNSELKRQDEVLVPELEAKYADDYGIINLKYHPVGELKLYSESSETESFALEGNTLNNLTPSGYYNIFYERKEKGVPYFTIGERWIKGYMRMTAKAKMKDDQTGRIKTLFIDLPKVQLTSELNMLSGSSESVMMGNFSVVAHPVGDRHQTGVGKFIFLGSE